MERAQMRTFALGTHELYHALTHLCRGLVGE